MTTARENTPAASSARQRGLRASSFTPVAWMVASSPAPQFAAAQTASTSAPAAISSTAMTCGDMARRTMGTPSALGQPSSTSVWLPSSVCGQP